MRVCHNWHTLIIIPTNGIGLINYKKNGIIVSCANNTAFSSNACNMF